MEPSAAKSPASSSKLDHWKRVGRREAVTIFGTDGRSTPGEVYVQNWDPPARMKRALKALGLCVGGALAVFMTLIPVMHLLLAVAILIAAPIVAFSVYGQESAVLGGSGTCPKCGQPLPLVGGKPNWPLKDLCGNCLESVRIEKAGDTLV
jgi:hypothetical protein